MLKLWRAISRLGPIALGLYVTAFALGQAPAATAGGSHQELFAWSMEPRFTPDAHGRFRDTAPADVSSGPWQVHLQVTGAPCVDGDVYHWSVTSKVPGAGGIQPRRTVACAFSMWVPRLGTYAVRLTANVRGQLFRE